MNIVEGLQLVILLLQRIAAARAAGLEAIEIDDLGEEFAAVNDRIQAARGE